MGVLDTMAAATPLRRSAKLCLDGALQAEWDVAQASLDAALDEDKKHSSLAEPLPNTTRTVDGMEDLRARVAASEVEFVFERVDWAERVALQAAHPPREGNPADQLSGHNISTYVPALIRRSVVQVVGADGDVETEIPGETWDRLLGAPAVEATEDQPARPAVVGSLNLKQINKLYGVAFTVNEGETAVPPSARFLLESQDSGASSTPPGPGESAPTGSAGGSRRTPQKSSATKKATPSRARSNAS